MRGLLHCGICERRMQGNWNNNQPHYRCRFAQEYALSNRIEHPLNVYLREAVILDPLDRWLSTTFAPHQLNDTITRLEAAQAIDATAEPAIAAARQALADCDRRLARYRATLDAGGDLTTVARWISEVEAQRATAQTQLQRATTSHQPMTRAQITQLINAVGDLLAVLRTAEPTDKAAVYQQLGIRIVYKPNAHTVQVSRDRTCKIWAFRRVRGAYPPKSPYVRRGSCR